MKMKVTVLPSTAVLTLLVLAAAARAAAGLDRQGAHANLEAGLERHGEHAGLKQVPVTVHQKAPGNGYLRGSPLYEKQEEHRGTQQGQRLLTEALPPGVDPPKGRHGLLWWILYWTLSFLFYFLPVLIAAALYRKFHKTDPLPPIDLKGDWHYGLFECFRDFDADKSICLMAWCCPAIRWADTTSSERAKRLGFWPALVLFLLLSIWLAPITGGISSTLLLCYCVYLRQQMRKTYQFKEVGGSSWAMDCLSWCCCPCCAILQEARQVERSETVRQFTREVDKEIKAFQSQGLLRPQTQGALRPQ